MNLFKRKSDKPKIEVKPTAEKINCLFCNSDEAVPFRETADIVKCQSCQIIYLRTRPTKEKMYEIYQAYANDTSHLRLPTNVAEAKQSDFRREKFVKEIKGFVKGENNTWLDIGCGWGALLDCAQEQGFKPKGIELTLDSIDFAVMVLGIPVSNNQFTDSRIGKESCTVISMAHVLEHIPNPKETIQKIYDTLEPDGMFCGIVPNIESFCSDKLKEDWVWLDPNYHYVHYSQATLKNKLEEAGFKIERMYTAVGDYGYDNFVDCLKTEFTFESEDEILLKTKELEKNGKGEEIRFFARK